MTSFGEPSQPGATPVHAALIPARALGQVRDHSQERPQVPVSVPLDQGPHTQRMNGRRLRLAVVMSVVAATAVPTFADLVESVHPARPLA